MSFSAGQDPSIPTPVKEICFENDCFSISDKRDEIPEGDIQPSFYPVFFYGGIEFQISFFPIADLSIDTQYRAQGLKPLRKDRADPILLDAVGHHKLFYLHENDSFLFYMVMIENGIDFHGSFSEYQYKFCGKNRQ